MPIVIISRSDRQSAVPRIILRAGNGTADSEAVESLRSNLLRRNRFFGLSMTREEADACTPDLNGLAVNLVNRACSWRRPFVSDDFDYLRRSLERIVCRTSVSGQRVAMNYEISYMTTREQEDEITRILDRLFKERGVRAMRAEIDRIMFVYGFIASRVSYDRSLARHSAYDALVAKSAVCEGCAALLYRMLSMSGVPCRIITGRGRSETHAWNLVKLDGMWYNADVTWDLRGGDARLRPESYRWLLKAGASFAGHTRDAEFSSPEFEHLHPMAAADFIPRTGF